MANKYIKLHPTVNGQLDTTSVLYPEVKAGSVNSGNATDGQVLAADGQGHSIWKTVESPEIEVDQEYDATSANAQSGTAVAEAISTKQNTLAQGIGITITNNTINAAMGFEDLQFPITPEQPTLSGTTLGITEVQDAEGYSIDATNTVTGETTHLGDIYNE